jgi:major type 1 subunit fimbrin (pilin)
MNKYAITLIASALGLAAVGAHAADVGDGTLTINGKLTAATCTVSGNGQGKDFTVTLPTLSAQTLSSAGATAGSTGFSIALTNCTPATGNVHTFWQYGANTLADGNLKNNGSAGNVEVQLVDYNGTPATIDVSKADGAQNSHTVAIASGAANLKYAAQYVSPAGSATAGDVTTSVTYSMSYQ